MPWMPFPTIQRDMRRGEGMESRMTWENGGYAYSESDEAGGSTYVTMGGRGSCWMMVMKKRTA